MKTFHLPNSARSECFRIKALTIHRYARALTTASRRAHLHASWNILDPYIVVCYCRQKPGTLLLSVERGHMSGKSVAVSMSWRLAALQPADSGSSRTSVRL